MLCLKGWRKMKYKKIKFTFLFVAILCVALSVSAFAYGSYNTNEGSPPSYTDLIVYPDIGNYQYCGVYAIGILDTVEETGVYYYFYVRDNELLYSSIIDYFSNKGNSNLNYFEYWELENQLILDIINSTSSFSNYYDLKNTINNIVGLYESNELYRNDISELNSRVNGLNITVNNLREEIEYYQDTIDTKDIVIRDLENQVEQLNGQLSSNYQQGFNDGLNESDAFKTGIMTIFSSPFNMFGEIFNFEIFGVNFYQVIQVIITVLLLSFVVKLFL